LDTSSATLSRGASVEASIIQRHWYYSIQGLCLNITQKTFLDFFFFPKPPERQELLLCWIRRLSVFVLARGIIRACQRLSYLSLLSHSGCPVYKIRVSSRLPSWVVVCRQFLSVRPNVSHVFCHPLSHLSVSSLCCSTLLWPANAAAANGSCVERGSRKPASWAGCRSWRWSRLGGSTASSGRRAAEP
jgi:hypothetical protein